MNEIVIQDFPGKQIQLERIAPEGMRSPADLARLAADALFLFAEGICEPLAMDLQVACCDPAIGYPIGEAALPRPYWLFHRRDLPHDVELRPAWTAEEFVAVKDLDAASILDCLEGPLAQHCDGGSGGQAHWQEMLFRAACVRLPLPAHAVAENSLTVRYGRGRVEHPIERRGDTVWVCGPLARKTLTAPMELSLSNEGGLLTFNIWLLWSLWIEEQNEGWAQVKHALDRLSEEGWVRSV
jgi:hypothetical protein